LSEAGYDAVLIGERFMTAEDPGRQLASLLAGLAELKESAVRRKQ
jgi:hypothetical protein